MRTPRVITIQTNGCGLYWFLIDRTYYTQADYTSAEEAKQAARGRVAYLNRMFG